MTSRSMFDFDALGLGSVLSRYRLAVPPNQREYSWKDNQVNRLFTDLAKALSDQEDEYFLGTVVAVPADQGVLEIVDGQQRLATTTILLAEIRNYLNSLSGSADKELAAHIDSKFIRQYVPKERSHKPNLSLNLDDNQFFVQMLEAKTKKEWPEPSHRSHEKIIRAFDLARVHVRNIVKPFDAKDHGDQLVKWQDFVQHKATVILMQVPDESKAYRMFETLNDRGLRTSQADMVKNYLFEQVAKDRKAEASQKWSYMRGALEAVEDEDLTVTFIRHALIASEEFVREDGVLTLVQDIVKGSDRAIRCLQTLEDLSRIYAALFNPEHEQWNGYPSAAQQSLEILKLFDVKPFRPLLLAIANSLHPGEAAKAFKYLVSLGVRLIIASSTRSESVEKPLATTAKKVYDKQLMQASEIRNELNSIWPTDDEFKQEFAQATVSKAVLARYYLRSLELGWQKDPEPQFIPSDDKDTITLEHVLPEKPLGNWPQFDEDSVKAYSRRLGNLALLKKSQNCDLRSEGFTVKKAVYADSSFALTEMISKASDWTKLKITERQNTLADLAVKVWDGK